MYHKKISCNKKTLKKSIKKCNLKGGLYQIQDEQTGKINKIIAFGYMYQTLNNHEVISDVLVNSPKTYQHLPNSFQVAPGEPIDIYICSNFNWQSNSLVFSDGTRCGTALNKYTRLEKKGKNLINIYFNEDEQTLYSTKYETMDILLRMPLSNYNEIDEINFNDYIYRGQWMLGNKHGKGIEILADGETYEGDWYLNIRQGKGIQKLADGETYEGDWYINTREGKGIQKLPDGETYEGDWYVNEREGKGIQKLPDGETYEGDWYLNKRQGKGIQKLPDGETYEGDWYLNKREGKGIQKLPDGETYEGDWHFGEKKGTFIKTYKNGQKKNFLYFTNNIFTTYEIGEYIIDNQLRLPENKYITILLELHGSDIINSKCFLNETKHVRLISPVVCGKSNLVSKLCTMFHFNIAYNTTHIVMNNNASTYQKNEKIIELLNQYYTEYYYDKQHEANKRPLIDHSYSIEYKYISGIYLIDTNYNPNLGKSISNLFFPRIDEYTDGDFDFETQRPKNLIELSSADIIKEIIEGLNLNHNLKDKLETIPNPPDGNTLDKMNQDEINRWIDSNFEPEIQNIICNYMLGMKSRNTFLSEQKFNKIKDRSIDLSNISKEHSLYQFNILPEILNHLPNREEYINISSFYRSTLINMLSDMGYDTINLIDLSCRNTRELILDDRSNLTNGKNYQCTYEQSEDPTTHISDYILSTGM